VVHIRRMTRRNVKAIPPKRREGVDTTGQEESRPGGRRQPRTGRTACFDSNGSAALIVPTTDPRHVRGQAVAQHGTHRSVDPHTLFAVSQRGQDGCHQKGVIVGGERVTEFLARLKVDLERRAWSVFPFNGGADTDGRPAGLGTQVTNLHRLSLETPRLAAILIARTAVDGRNGT